MDGGAAVLSFCGRSFVLLKKHDRGRGVVVMETIDSKPEAAGRGAMPGSFPVLASVVKPNRRQSDAPAHG
ncbi:MAG: hypothetical protein H6712_06575 [Myxococcales bacterium]|nr:hypothetical protein [Myxococcales bacterium]MCB9713500.1 hypothetical protein [Myxococcales bacterium]